MTVATGAVLGAVALAVVLVDLESWAPFIVIGLATGSVFGLAGIGLVLTFKTTGVFNFAHGGIAAAAAYVFYDLHHEAGLPWPLALLISVVAFGVVVGVFLEWIARALGESRVVISIVATVGLLVGIQGLLALQWGSATLPFPVFLPTSTVRVAGVEVGYWEIIVALVGLATAVGLLVFFRRARLGLAMRAVVDDPTLLSLSSIPPVRVRRAAWILGSSFAALSGVLVAMYLGRDPLLLTLLVVQAFGAAAVGRFSSMPLTYVGGLIVGIGSQVATRYTADYDWLQGLPTSFPFVVLFVALLVTPARRLAVRAPAAVISRARVPAAWSPRRRMIALASVAVVVWFIPTVVGTNLPGFTQAALLMPMLLSLGLLVWTSGQISLSHAAFVALGATTYSHLTAGAGLPFLPALVLAGVAVVPMGAVVALPAIRQSGIYLALATFGFGLLVQQMLYRRGWMFGDFGFREATRPEWWLFDATDDRTFFVLVSAVAVVCIGLVAAIQRSRLGRVLRALGDSPAALSSLGADANMARLLVFCVAGFFAGISGALMVMERSAVSGDTFGLQQSLLWLAVLGICGRNLISGPILAAVLLGIMPVYLPDGWLDYQPVAFGVAAVAVGVLVDRVYRLGRRSAGRPRRSPVPPRPAPAGSTRARSVDPSTNGHRRRELEEVGS